VQSRNLKYEETKTRNWVVKAGRKEKEEGALIRISFIHAVPTNARVRVRVL
jgi:hypothetical protein